MYIVLKLTRKQQGFTLLEILFAMFIFTLLSMMLMTGLHTVINAHEQTENKAQQLRELQLTLLVISRDIEQAIDRPVLNASGKEELAFIGDGKSMSFTHLGMAASVGAHNNLQRVQYVFQGEELKRQTWASLDQAPATLLHTRNLLKVNGVRLEYLDQAGKFQREWPLNQAEKEHLPRAVRIYFSFKDWGEISQLYLIPARSNYDSPV